MTDLPLPPSTLAPATGAATPVACRACPVLCDRVVYPSACLDRCCPNLYSYVDARGRRFAGCLEGVFASEIDLDLLAAAVRAGGFGGLRCARPPLTVCHTEVERAYPHRADALGCVNPEFFESPAHVLQVERRHAAS
jgi:hypothetical protein